MSEESEDLGEEEEEEYLADLGDDIEGHFGVIV